MPHVLNVVVVFEHVQHLGQVLNIGFVGNGDVVLGNHFHLSGYELVACLR